MFNQKTINYITITDYTWKDKKGREMITKELILELLTKINGGNLKPFRGEIRTNGLSGSERSYFTWDCTHCNIEKFNHRGKHMGSIDPVSGNVCKSAVPGRSIKL